MEYMEQQMQNYIEAGINERERCYNEITELEHLRDKYKELYESSMLSEATAKQYAEEVDKQNKELAAQVEALRNIKRYNQGHTTVSYGYERWSVPVLNEDKKGPIIKAEDLDAILAATPQQHLLERDAQKGRAGFIACLKHFHRYDDKTGMMAIDDRNAANQYADSIRRSEVK